MAIVGGPVLELSFRLVPWQWARIYSNGQLHSAWQGSSLRSLSCVRHLSLDKKSALPQHLQHFDFTPTDEVPNRESPAADHLLRRGDFPIYAEPPNPFRLNCRVLHDGPESGHRIRAMPRSWSLLGGVLERHPRQDILRVTLINWQCLVCL